MIRTGVSSQKPPFQDGIATAVSMKNFLVITHKQSMAERQPRHL